MSVADRPKPPRPVPAPPGSALEVVPASGSGIRPRASKRDRDPTPMYGVPILERKSDTTKKTDLAETKKIPDTVVGEIQVEARDIALSAPSTTIVVDPSIRAAVASSGVKSRRQRGGRAKLALGIGGVAVAAALAWALFGGQDGEPKAASAKATAPETADAASLPAPATPETARADLTMAAAAPAPTLAPTPTPHPDELEPEPSAEAPESAERSATRNKPAQRNAGASRPSTDEPPPAPMETAPPPPPPPPGSTSREETPSASASRLLAEARKASMTGRNRSAWQLASRSYAIEKSTDALQVMGVAACKMGDRHKAQDAHRRLPAPRRSALAAVCSAHGLEL